MKIGIDLGSTYTSVARYNTKKDEPEELVLSSRYPASIPSLVCIKGTGDNADVYCGFAAKDHMGDVEYKVYEAFKMLLVESNQNVLTKAGYDRINTPRKIAAMFLKYVLSRIMKEYKTDDDHEFELIYICVPERWTQGNNILAIDGENILREILLKDVGMDVKKVKVVSEPEAASAFFAKNYEKESKKRFNGHLLMIDYGGGTLDITLTKVDSFGNNTMEISYLDSKGAGENHENENGEYRIGDAGIAFIKKTLTIAIEESGQFVKGFVPDTGDHFFAKAYKNLETDLYDKTEDIEEEFGGRGRFSEFKEILNERPKRFCTINYQNKEITVTYQHIYRAYESVIYNTLNSELDKINKYIIDKLGFDPRRPEAGNKDDFKIAKVGGFSTFYLVESQIADKYNILPGTNDLRVKNINTNKRALAVSLGASLLAAGQVKLSRIARYSIGLVSRNGVGLPVVKYGIKYHQILSDDPNVAYHLLSNDRMPDVRDNWQPFIGSLHNQFKYLVIERSESLTHGDIARINKRFQNAFRNVDMEGLKWYVGFYMDKDGVINMRIDYNDTAIPPQTIRLDNFNNLFDFSQAVEIRKVGDRWEFSEEIEGWT